MKKLAILFILFTFCISGCNKDEIIPLPENITIQILDYDIDDSSVLILGSEPQDGLEGKWSIENNVSDGAFVDSNNSLTTFRGTLIKDYLLRWTITNGADEIYTEQLVNIGMNFTLNQLLNEEVELNILLEKFSIQELINGGVLVRDLLDGDVSIQQLLTADVSIQDILSAGGTIQELMSAEVSIQELISSGVSVADLLAADVSIQQLLTADVSIQDILSAGGTIQELMSAEVSIQELISSGVTVNELIDSGVTIQQLLAAVVPIQDIIEAGVSSLELINNNVSKDDLLQADVIKQIPNTGYYILNYLYEKFEHIAAVNFCNNLTVGDMNNWSLPTIEELRIIYSVKNTILLEHTSENYWSSTYVVGGDVNGNPSYYVKHM